MNAFTCIPSPNVSISTLHTVLVVGAALAAVRTTVQSHTSLETVACCLLRSLVESRERPTCLLMVAPARSSRQVEVLPKPEPVVVMLQIQSFVAGQVVEQEPERSHS